MIIRALIVALAVLALPFFANLALAQDANQLRIVVPAHSIARGDTIGDSDLTYATVSPDAAQGAVVTAMGDIDGMQSRRVLRAGEAIRLDDVRKPVLVAKGSTVTMIFNAPGITLTAVGKATSEGGMGDTVSVLNPISYRQISCMVTGAGQVTAGVNSLTGTQVASVQK